MNSATLTLHNFKSLTFFLCLSKSSAISENYILISCIIKHYKIHQFLDIAWHTTKWKSKLIFWFSCYYCSITNAMRYHIFCCMLSCRYAVTQKQPTVQIAIFTRPVIGTPDLVQEWIKSWTLKLASNTNLPKLLPIEFL